MVIILIQVRTSQTLSLRLSDLIIIIGRQLSGCFADNLQQIKIDVERCGCNSATTLNIAYLTLLLSVLISSAAIYFMS